MTFTPLRVRSHGSLLHGVASPEALIGRALALGYDALALTDRDNLYLAIRFWQQAHKEGLRPLLGAEVGAGAHSALLLPLDRRGYSNLCALLTRRMLDAAFDPVTALGERHGGLHVIVESSGFAASLLAAGVPAARERGSGAAGGLWFGVRGIGAERARLRERIAAGRALGVPLVATGDCVLLEPGDHDTHRVAVTAGAGELLERMNASAFCTRDAVLVAPHEWERRVRAVCAASGDPDAAVDALANNAELVRRCRLELELGTPIFPRAPLTGATTGREHLMALGREGVARRYPQARRAAALARLTHELEVIQTMGFTDYFLLVAEIVRFTRAEGIPSVGRGSGAASLVAYALGITNVDPLHYRLYFERFLNSARRDCPDLDIDLCWKRRDEVIAHVYRTYGDDRAAMISTHATLGPRSAFRETAKALGVPSARVDALAKRIPRALGAPYLEQLLTLPDARRVDWREPPLAEALRLAERMNGAPRHLSVHSGGVVIADRALTDYVPLERAAKDIVVTQFEMRAIEAIGLVKMDLLGNRALTTIGDCIELVREHHGVDVDLAAIPGDDARTGAAIRVGDALNCFQLESPAMRHLLKMLDAHTLDETIAAVALVRPGPAESGMKEIFCRRHRGLEPDAFLDPRLVDALGDTHGVMLYEEDVMAVAAAMTGMTLAEGEALRRAIGGAREDGEFRSLERGFVALARRGGADDGTARAVWRELTRFAAYSFCKAHAAGYGTLGWHSAWLKTRFPTEYAVGVLNNHAGMYPTWVHVEDLRRKGVAFRAPCTRRSAWDSTWEEGAVRVGLGRVFGLSEETGARIVAVRVYSTLADFTDRVRPALAEMESLILAGALDWTGRSRSSLLLEARVSGARPAASRRRPDPRAPALAGADGVGVLPRATPAIATPDLPEFGVAERMRGEIQATGLWFSAHPLDAWARPEALAGTVPAASLEKHVGRRVAVAGLPCAYRRIETKRGGRMLFMTLADRSGLAECVLFPDSYRAFAEAIRGQVVRAEGRVDETLDSATLTVERATALEPGRAADAPRGAEPYAAAR